MDSQAASISQDENGVTPPRKKRKNWQELRQNIRNIRRQLSNVSTKVPSSFAFRHGYDDSGSSVTRIYFLSTLATGRETTLLFADVPSFVPPDCSNTQFPWQNMLESSFQVLHPMGRFSREEQLQWERKRLVMWGITAYDFHSESGRFVFPACGSIFSCEDNGSKQPPYFPNELKSIVSGARLNPQICQWNPNLVAYVYNNDLWVHNIASACEVRLTFTRKGNGTLSEEPFSAGIPSYVTQEEFNRYNGYWWQPVCLEGDDTYRILYEEVDESEVQILQLPSFGDDRSVEEYRFPRAGTANARSILKMVNFSLSESGQIENVTQLQCENLQSLFPECEYIVRIGWTPDGKNVWAQVLNRSQHHLQLVLIPLSHFLPLDDCDLSFNHMSNKPAMQVIYEEFSEVWINVHDILHFFPQETKNEWIFLWGSEESGFRHLYIITVSLLSEGAMEGIPDSPLCKAEVGDVSKRITKKVALTSGDWEVSEKDVWVDEERQLVYFIGLQDTPLERHLYVTSLRNPGKLTRLTPSGFSHAIAMDRECTMFVSVESNIFQTPFAQVFQLNHKMSSVTSEVLGYLLEPAVLEPDYPQPELFSHQIQSGYTVYGMLFKPVGMEPGKKYPTVLIIYGGPEVQLVTNTFKGMRHLRQHLLATEGYVVVAMDCRGSRHRGVAFEGYIKGRMGTVEISDQVEVLQWLAESYGCIDMDRVAIHGWSYGGYLSLMGLAQRPDIFKIAIAGAPVTTWTLYDTGYTERYMDTPTNNPQGYSSGSVLTYVNQLPNEENRLLIIHGLMDENVHFTHTSQLVSALIKASKPYQLQVYPTERHSLRHLEASEHYETTLLSFLQQHL